MAKQERAIITRDSIIVAAADVFAGSGYGESPLSEIVERSGVTKGALYFHFKSKESLAVAVLEEQHRIVMDGAERVEMMARPALDSMILTSVDFCRQLLDSVVVRAGIRLTLESPDIGSDMTSLYEDWVTSTEHLIHRGIGEGGLRPVLGAADAARLIVGAFTGVQTLSEVLTGRADLLARVEHLWTALIPGLVPRESVDDALALPGKLFAEFGERGIR